MTRMRSVNLILLGLASVGLLLLLRRIDWEELFAAISQGGRYWLWLLLPYGLTSYLWALSWRFLLVSGVRRPSISRLFWVRLAGDSLNQLTPTAAMGGEPFKALRLMARGVSWQEATASVLIHKVLMVLSLVLYILAGLALVPFALPGVSREVTLLSLVATGFLAAGGIGFLIVQRRNPCISSLRLLQRFHLCPAALAAKESDLASLDQSLALFYREHPGAGLTALLLFFLGWALHAVEVWLIFKMLGHPIDLETAFCLDALSQLVAGLGFMIPASLGVQDGGNVLLTLGFNLGATLGAGFSILRRFREAFWLLLGLAVAAREK